MDNILEQFEILQFERDSLTYLPGKYFRVYKMKVNNLKTLFLFRPSLGTHTIHFLLFCLRTPLIIYLNVLLYLWL